MAGTSLDAFRSTSVVELSRREREVMELFSSIDVALSRKQIFLQLQAQFGCSAPGEGGCCGRVNSLVAKQHLVHRGERLDPKTRKPQELVGLPIAGQGDLF